MRVTHAQRSVKGEDGLFAVQTGRFTLAGVVDGHGGKGCMLACNRELPAACLRGLEAGSTLEEALRRGVRAVAARVRDELSGCCVSCVVVDALSREYACANLGDVHGLHITPTSFWRITESHRLQDNARVRDALRGHVGFISSNDAHVGPPRLYPGGVTCAHALGDADCPHVVATPHVTRGSLGPADVLCIASDGVWDACWQNKVVRYCRDSLSAEAVMRRVPESADDASLLLVTSLSERPRRLSWLHRSSSGSSIASDDEPLVLSVPLQ